MFRHASPWPFLCSLTSRTCRWHFHGRKLLLPLIAAGRSLWLLRSLMPRWSWVFFAGPAVLGFTGISSGASGIARYGFFFLLVVLEISLIWGFVTGRKISMPS